jgi:hypothetical protein
MGIAALENKSTLESQINTHYSEEVYEKFIEGSLFPLFDCKSTHKQGSRVKKE